MTRQPHIRAVRAKPDQACDLLQLAGLDQDHALDRWVWRHANGETTVLPQSATCRRERAAAYAERIGLHE